MNHFNIKIYGRVQGVFFRVMAKEKADTIGITGFARNDPDGVLYIEAEGEEENLKQFVAWCKIGPDLAQVERVEVSKSTLKNFSGFKFS